jgi:hypothetical protein
MPSPTPVPIAALLSTTITVSPSDPVRPSPPQVLIAALLSVPIAVPAPAPIAAVIPEAVPIATLLLLEVSPQATPLLPIVVHSRRPTSPYQGRDLSAVAPAFHPRLRGKFSVMDKLPAGSIW